MKDIILKRRKELGMTQKDLANKLYISDKVVSKWETGKSIPDTTILVELSKALEITVNELLNVDNANVTNVTESNKIILNLKYKNITIIFITIKIIAALLMVIQRVLADTIGSEDWHCILIIGGGIIELINISYLLIARNNLFTKYSKLLQVDKKYMNYIICMSFFIVMLVISVFILWGNSVIIEQPFKIIGIVFFILLIVLSLFLFWNNKRK